MTKLTEKFSENPVCRDCIRLQMAKYKDYVDETGHIYRDFAIHCTGIPTTYINEKHKQVLNEEELKEAEILLDPVAWAKKYVKLPDGEPWIARWYQEQMLQCTSRRKVSRCGRRVGKCSSPSSRLITVNGPIVLQELYELDKKDRPAMLVYNTETSKLEITEDYEIYDNGIKSIIKLTTKTGRTNEVTKNHPFLVLGENGKYLWKNASELIVGDKIAVPRSYKDLIPGSSFDTRKARFLGYLTGDGGTSQGYVGFTNFDKDAIDDLRDIAADFDCKLVSNPKRPGKYYVRRISHKRKENKALTFTRLHGLQGKLAIQKEAPKVIMNGTKEVIANFLGAYWDCDGWCCVGKYISSGSHKRPKVEVGIASSSEQLARDTHHLLLRLGIISYFKKKKVKYQGEYRYTWQVVISRAEDIKSFAEQIPLRAKKKNLNQVLSLISKQIPCENNITDSIPQEIWAYIKSVQENKKMTNMRVCGAQNRLDNIRLRTQYSPCRSKVLKYGKNLNDKYLQELANSDILWDQIKEIELLKEKQTLAVTVPHTHTLILDDIISHNSDSIAVDILYNCFTKGRTRVLIVAPYKAQTEEIIGRIRGFARSNVELGNAIARDVSSPYYEIQFHNGSRIRGFSSGTKSGAEGVAIRGQDADRIYLDEADYLMTGDLSSIVAILNTHPQVTLWASSTPTGKRQHFYRWCTDTPTYKEFYFPSMVLPHWEEVKDDFRLEYAGRPDEWTHEICLAKNTFIKTTSGSKAIQDIVTGDYVYDHNSKPVLVTKGAWKTGTKETISVSLPYNQFNVQATPDHKFPDRNFQKKPLEELNELPVYRHKTYDIESRARVMARLVGYNLGDGTVNSTRFQSSFYSNNHADMQKLISDVRYLWPEFEGQICSDIIKKQNKPNALVKVDGPRHTVNVSANITKKLLQHGAVIGKKVEKEFRVPGFVRRVREWRKIRKPTPIYTMCRLEECEREEKYDWFVDEESWHIKKEFVAALFGAEGSTPRDSDGYMPSTVSLSMAKRRGVDGSVFFDDLREILSQLNIRSTWTSSDVGENIIYTLYVYNDFDNIKRFFDIIGYRYAEEKEDLAFYWNCYLGHYQWELLKKQQAFAEARAMRQKDKTYKETAAKTGLTSSQIDKAVNQNRYPQRLYKEFLQFDGWLTEHFHQGAIFLPIREEPYKHQSLYDTYNITVASEDHSYLLENGIRVFNCAEFGEQTVGVFQNAFIDRATTEYKYSEMRREPNWIYAMGVDWNDDRGTEIVVTGYNGHGGFQVVDALNVPKQEWTQIKGMEAVISMNAKWVPEFLYMDAGFGNTNIELLKKHGHDVGATDPTNPAVNLYNNLVNYDFGSKIDVYDPVTKQQIKKDAKPFLVENSVRRFEESTIKISAFDSTLIRQLEGYIIDHRTPAGRPTYKTMDERIGDHRLDAFMLSLVSFKLEMSDFGTPNYDTHIAISPGFGDGLQNQDKRQRELERNKRAPEGRFEVDELVFVSERSTPGNVSKKHGTGRVCSQEAWATDREEEFARKYKLRKMRQKIMRRRQRPERKNI